MSAVVCIRSRAPIVESALDQRRDLQAAVIAFRTQQQERACAQTRSLLNRQRVQRGLDPYTPPAA